MTATSTSRKLLTALLPEWHLLLQGWASSGRLTAAAQEALLLNGEPQALKTLASQWSKGDCSAIPEIVLLSAADMNRAMGAYAISTGKIYFNQDWLATATKEQVFAVLTEELGHQLDGVLNVVDTPGDEGESFARLLAGEKLTDHQKAKLRTESDGGMIAVGGVNLWAEYAALAPVIRGNSIYTIVDGPSWNAAEANSVAVNGHLATIENDPENAYLSDIFSNADIGGGLWVGLSDATVEGQWKWSSGSISSFVKWNIGQPDNSTFFSASGQDFAFLSAKGSTDFPKGIWDDSTNEERNINGIAEIPFIRRGDSAYVIVEGPTWFEAQGRAQKLGGNLVTINDVDEQSWLSSWLPGENLWIGLNDSRNELNWEWVGGEIVTYTNWHPEAVAGFENNVQYTIDKLNGAYPEGEDYVLMYGSNRLWDDGVGRHDHGQWLHRGIAEIKLAPNNAPTGTPTLSGSFRAGQTISLNKTPIQDADNFTGWTPTYTYGWEVSSNGTSWTRLTSADATDNNSTYSLTAADVGKKIRGVVGYLDGYGSNESVNSVASTGILANNLAPTEVALSAYAFNENIPAGSVIATLTSTDPDAGNTFTYSLVAGIGSTDNGSFSIAGNQLKIKALPNYEVKSAYSVRVRTKDQGGLVFDKSFALAVNNVIEKVTASVSTVLSANKDTLELTGASNIFGMGNQNDNWITGNSGKNKLTGGLGKDFIAGSLGADTFFYSSLQESLLTGFDVITDYAIGEKINAGFNFEGDDLMASAGKINALEASQISSLLTTSKFKANNAAAFFVKNLPGTFVALNDARSGFQADTDALSTCRTTPSASVPLFRSSEQVQFRSGPRLADLPLIEPWRALLWPSALDHDSCHAAGQNPGHLPLDGQRGHPAAVGAARCRQDAPGGSAGPGGGAAGPQCPIRRRDAPDQR